MAENEISVAVERDRKFFERIDTLEGGTQIFKFEHAPHLGLLSPEPRILLIPGEALRIFNPPSIDDLKLVKEGDLVQVTSDPNHPVYVAWNPSEEYQIPEGFSRTMQVKFVTEDTNKLPVLGLEEAI